MDGNMDFTVARLKACNYVKDKTSECGEADILERDDRVYDDVQSSHRRGRFSEQHRYI